MFQSNYQHVLNSVMNKYNLLIYQVNYSHQIQNCMIYQFLLNQEISILLYSNLYHNQFLYKSVKQTVSRIVKHFLMFEILDNYVH